MNAHLSANVGSKEDTVLKIKDKKTGKVVAILKDDATEPELLEKKKEKAKKEEAEEEEQEE